MTEKTEKTEMSENTVNTNINFDHVQKLFNKIPALKSMLDDPSNNKKWNNLYDEIIYSIDDDFLKHCRVEEKSLVIDFLFSTVKIDLSNLIGDCIKNNKINVIKTLVNNKIDVFEFQPKILIMCVIANRYELLDYLLDSGNGRGIEYNDYDFIYLLAENGKLEPIKKIFEICSFANPIEIVCRICVKAINYNHTNILSHFLTDEVFASSPVMMYDFLKNSILQTAPIDVIKFFVEHGVNIRQKNYELLKLALEKNNIGVIKYFSDIDTEIEFLLTTDQKIKFGITDYDPEKKFIGTDKTCSIGFDTIEEEDRYFVCDNNLHFYKEEMWKKWI